MTLSELFVEFFKKRYANTPIQSRSKKYNLKIDNVKLNEIESRNTIQQRSARLRDKTFGEKVTADISIIDNITNKVLDTQKNWPIASVPVKTQRSSYIVKGKEWAFVKQLRLKQAPFIRHKTDDNLHEAFINVAGGAYRVIFDDNTLLMKLKIGTTHFHLYSLLKDLGISDIEMKKAWGDEIYNANIKKYDKDELAALYKKLRPYNPASDVGADVLKFFNSKALDEKVTKRTIGIDATHITPEVLLKSSEKILKLVRKEVPEDDTEHLAYKNLLDEYDLMQEKLEKAAPLIDKQIASSLDRKQTIAYSFSPLLYDKSVQEFFTRNDLSRYTDQFNPLSILRTSYLVTITGEGGLGSDHAVSDEMRAVHPSHMGVLDACATPEGVSIGITNHLSLGAKKIGKEIALDLYDAKTGKLETHTLISVADKTIGFYEDFDFSKTPPKAKKKVIMVRKPDGSMREESAKSIDYIFREARTFFDPVSSLNPFIHNTSGNRVLMGGKHIEQAVALKNPDRPWVQAEINRGQGYEDFIGKNLLVSPVDGLVIRKTSDYIIIKDKNGKEHTVYIHKKYPLNESVLYDEDFLVNKGDKVTKGQALSSSIFSKDGKSLTLGKNVKMVVAPYYGYNFEDGVVISDSCRHKFTSLHKHEESLELNRNTLFGFDSYVYHFPNSSNKLNPSKFNAKGLPKAGEKFYKNEIIVPAVLKTEPTAELEGDRLIRKLGYKPVDVSIVWQKDLPGVIISSIKSNREIKVILETEEPLQVGDKFCLSEDHEVLTSTGWKPIKDVDLFDAVATLQSDNTVLYTQPTNTTAYQVNEKLLTIDTEQISMCVTKEHKCYVWRDDKFKLVEASELGAVETFKVSAASQSKKDAVTFPPIIEIANAKLAENTQLTLFAMGKSGVIQPQIDGRCLVHVYDNNPTVEITDKNWKMYKGYVYCITVPNHVFYVRRNGRCHWTGNSSRHGSKGIDIKVIPDNEMLQDKNGEPYDMVFNPFAVPGRINPGIFFEAALAKVAKKTGKVIPIEAFKGGNTLEDVQQMLLQHGVEDKEEVYDPKTGQTHKFFVGEPHFYKLTHLVRKKMSARGAGATESYTVEEAPKRESGESGQSAGVLEIYSILAGGGLQYLKDVSQIISQKNDQWWRNYQMGLPTPPLDMPFVVQKFITYMRGAGVDLVQDGDAYKAVPLTDDKILEQSNGEIRSSKVVNDKLEPEKDGLFDPGKVGGLTGVYWNHIKLAKPIPNPIAEEAIIKVLGMKTTEFDKLMKGTLFWDKDKKKLSTDNSGITQGQAIHSMLENLNVEKELEKGRNELATVKISNRDNLIKKLKYLQGLKNLNKRPEEVYILNNLPVIPAKFRSIYSTPDGKVNISDPTQLYHEMLLINNQVKDLEKSGFDLTWSPNLVNELYNGAKAVIGVGDPLTPNAVYKGFFKIIKGAQNKFGLYQGRVVSRRRDLTGRSTIVVNPALGMDYVGIPKKIAVTQYAPFIMRRLINNSGMSAIDARDMIEKDPLNDLVLTSLESELEERPVLLSRAPTLHKYGVIGQKVKLVDGDAIQVNPLVIGGLNADFDGDCKSLSIIDLRLNSKKLLAYLATCENYENSLNIIYFLLKNADCDVKSYLDINLNKEVFMLQLKELLVKNPDTVMSIYIEDFPHEPQPYKTEENIEFYKVPDGIEVQAIDAEGKYSWLPVTDYTVHKNLNQFFVKYDHRGTTICSKDNTVLVFNPITNKLETVPTAQALNKLTPCLKRTPTNQHCLRHIDLQPYVNANGYTKKILNQSLFDLDHEEGYLLGVLIGDGWASWKPIATRTNGPRLWLANIDDNLVNRVRRILSKYFSLDGEQIHNNPHTYKGHTCISRSLAWSCAPFVEFIARTIHQGSENKRLPSWFFNTSEDFRLGLLSGLIDTDGTINISATNKYGVSYHSEHLQLAMDVKYLLLSLGVFSSISPYYKDLHGVNKEYYNLVVSTYDFAQQLTGKLNVEVSNKKAAWSTLQTKDWGNINSNAALAKNDIVPISEELAKAFSKRIGSKRNSPDDEKSLYTILRKALKVGSVSRGTARRLVTNYIVDHPQFESFKYYTENEDLMWDRVVEITQSGRTTMYDITVPGPCTFMTSDGLFFWDSCIGRIQLMEEVKILPLTKEDNYPITKIDAPLFNYIPDQDIATYVSFNTEGSEDVELHKNVYTTGVSVLNNDVGKYQVTKWHKHPNCRETMVKTWYGRELTVSANHSLVTYNPYTETFNKEKPTDSRFKCVPIVLGFDGEHSDLFGFGENDPYFIIYTFLLTRLVDNKIIYYCKKKQILDHLKQILKDKIDIQGNTALLSDATLTCLIIQTFKIDSTRILPYAVWTTKKEYRKNMLKAVRNYSLFIMKENDKIYPTIRLSSVDYTFDIKKLLSSLGISYQTKSVDNDRVIIQLNREAFFYQNELNLHGHSKPLGVMPVTAEEFSYIQQQVPNKIRDKSTEHKFIPVWLLTELLHIIDIPCSVKNRMITYSDNIYFDVITNVKMTGNIIQMYDLTVPGSLTFSMSDGIVVFDTVATAVPVSEEAKTNVFEMLPSNNIFSARQNYGEALMHLPSKEYVLGVYLMTKPVKMGDVIEYKDEGTAITSMVTDKVQINRLIKVKGEETCVGRLVIKHAFPDDIQVPNETLTKKKLEALLLSAAKKHPNQFSEIVDKVKDYGAYYVSHIGYSVGLSDLAAPLKERDKIIAEAESKIKTIGFNKAMEEADAKLLALTRSLDNALIDGAITSGAMSGKANQIQQMILSPVAVTDYKNEIVPVPIRKSFVEGYTIPEYWATLPGTRKGLMDKGLSTQVTGAFGKVLLSGVSQITIRSEDCGTTNGVSFSTDDKNILDRYVAEGKYRNELMTSDLQKKLIDQGIKTIIMRSPLKCRLTDGICVKCWGVNEDGKAPSINFPVGALAGTSATEPITQATLRVFHTGGAVGAKSLGWKAIDILFKQPKNIANKAILARQKGTVKKIEESSAGTYNITIQEGTSDVIYKIPKGLELSVAVGEKVLPGKNLSKHGFIHPQELLEVTGDIHKVEDYMLGVLDSTYKDLGVNFKRKILEVLVSPMVKTVRVENIEPKAAVHLGIYPGDFISKGEAEFLDKNKKILNFTYEPVLTSVKNIPHISNDLLMELMSDSPHKSLAKAPLIQKKLDPRSSPISQFVFGTIGDKTKPTTETEEERSEKLLTNLARVFDINGLSKEIP